MKANHKLLLQDFKNDSSDIRLQLFIHSVNPDFKLNKTTKPAILQLINDYFKDPKPNRLNNISNYINSAGNQFQGNTIKPSQIKKPTKSQLILAEKNTEEIAKIDELRNRLVLIRKQIYLANLNKTNPPLEWITEEQKIKQELDQIDILSGRQNPEGEIRNPVIPEKSKLDVVLGLFGHWEKPGTKAHELVYGNTPRMLIRANQDVKQAVLWLGELSGKPMRQFWVQNNEMQGGVKGFVPTWTITATNSGLAPINENMSVMFNGQNNDAMAERLFKMV